MDSGRKPEEKTETMAAKYVECVVSGVDRRDAARQAGYSDNTKLNEIERVGGPVHRLVMALDAYGLNENFLARNLRDGIEGAQKSGAKDKDLGALAHLLKNLGILLGHGKSGTPVVQVNNQINNQIGSLAGIPLPNDPDGLKALAGEVSDLLALVKETIGKRESAGVLDGDHPLAGGSEVSAEAQAHPGVGGAGSEPPPTQCGGGA